MGKFLVKQTKTGFVFNLKANNGQVIATSEVYTTKSACDKGIASVAKNAPIADVEDQTEAGFGTYNYERTVCSIDPDRYA